MRSIGRALLIAALCLSLGGQWLALQSVAWATMLVHNSREVPLAAAVAKTFDGAHPCGLCHAVEKGQKGEKKSAALPLTVKLDLICPPRTPKVEPASKPYGYPAFLAVIPTQYRAPLVPPPRSFLS